MMQTTNLDCCPKPLDFASHGPESAQRQLVQELASAIQFLAAIRVPARCHIDSRVVSIRDSVPALHGPAHLCVTKLASGLEQQHSCNWQHGSYPLNRPVCSRSSCEGHGNTELIMESDPQGHGLGVVSRTMPQSNSICPHTSQSRRAGVRCMEVQVDGTNEVTSSGSSAGGMERNLLLAEVEPWHTTLVVRNIPARCSHERLLQQWPNNGSYDFLFVPYSVKQRRASRYMFINFTSHKEMVSFMMKWHGAWLPDASLGPKLAEPLEMRPAKMQGLRANVRHHRSTASNRHRPAVFQDGHRADFCQMLDQLGVEPSDSGDGTSQDTDSDDVSRGSLVGFDWRSSSLSYGKVDRPGSLILSF